MRVLVEFAMAQMVERSIGSRFSFATIIRNCLLFKRFWERRTYFESCFVAERKRNTGAMGDCPANDETCVGEKTNHALDDRGR
jgi:hypothetical protein